MPAHGLVHKLRRAGIADVRADRTTLHAYSSDASLYRLLPQVVVMPRSADDVHAAISVCRELDVPLTARGGGTSVAGNAVGRGVVLDFSRHMNQIIELDVGARGAVVEPGVVLADLQRLARPHGLRFGPDPSTSSRCTVGGMMGNNACGTRSLVFGKTSDNVRRLVGIAGTGAHFEAVRGSVSGFESGVEAIRRGVAGHLDVVRREAGRFGRQVSGLALEYLLPENGFDLPRFLVGSEGTLAVTTRAELDLHTLPRCTLLVILGFADFPSAGDAAPAVVAHRPSACEGLDARLVDVVRSRGRGRTMPELPRGRAWLLVELSGEDPLELDARAARLLADMPGVEARIVTDQAEVHAVWAIRRDGAGLAGRAPSGKPAWAGWEDSAVPPANLGSYLREFEALLDEYSLTAMPFGHFGEGCLHVRLDFDLSSDVGRARYKDFINAAAAAAIRHDGSLSGEHGDGRARSELLPLMYSQRVLDLFRYVKGVFDPDGILNPGVLVRPAPADLDLRSPAARLRLPVPALRYEADDGDFAQAVHRCTGIGKCRSVEHGPGTVMCPSYAATRNEQDSTRGRARVLQELMAGHLEGGWRSEPVREALDLCLSCKGCLSDCPTGVDMASYKSEVLHQGYRWRVRPRSHYSLGWLPRWARFASWWPALANRVFRSRILRRGLLAVAGVDGRRSVPSIPSRTFRRRRDSRAPATLGGRRVVLFVDSFTNHLSPDVGEAAVAVLADAGYRAELSPREACCGLTWISTGQLDAARRRLRRTVALLLPAVREGALIVGVEPSCTAVLRHDVLELVGTDAAHEVARATRTLSELLMETPGWVPPDLTGLHVVAQPHCHHNSVMGWGADAALLRAMQATVTELGGCCGLAGNWGMEVGHYDTSLAIAGQQLLPALAGAASDHIVLADGFSCRTQISDLSSRQAHHLAELLASNLPRSPIAAVTDPTSRRTEQA